MNIKTLEKIAQYSLRLGIVLACFGVVNLTGIFEQFWDGRISFLAIGIASLLFSPKSYFDILDIERNRSIYHSDADIRARYGLGMSLILGILTMGIFFAMMLGYL